MRRLVKKAWVVPAAFSIVMLTLSLYSTLSAESGRGYLIALSVITSLLVGAVVFVYRELLRPRLGSASSYALVSLVVFVLAFLMALLSPQCPTGAESSRCSLSESVAAGFSMMLLPLVVATASSLVVLTKLSLYALRAVLDVVGGKSRRQRPTPTKKSGKTKKPIKPRKTAD